MTLSKLHRKNCNIVTFLKPFGKSSACNCFLSYFGLMFFEIADSFAVAAQRAGSEEAIVAWLHQVGTARCECGYRNKSGLGVNVIATEEIDAIKLVRRNKALDLVENGERVKRADSRFESLGCEPDCVAVSFAHLSAA